MRRQFRSQFFRSAFGWLLAAGAFYQGLVFAQGPTTNAPWSYQLLSDSSLLDNCLPCDHISRPVPMRGGFDLRLIDQNPISARYAIENIQFTAGDRPYKVTGGGVFEIGGEVAITTQTTLTVQIDDGNTNKTCYFTNTTTTPDRQWPMLDITVAQTNGTLTQVYTLRIAAAPLREIWFSTVNPFTAGAGSAAPNLVRGGDLLSTVGRIVKRNADLFTSVGAFPPAPDLGLDAIDILPGGEIAFSLGTDITSQTLGLLQEGDLLSNKGRIIADNQALLSAFNPSLTKDYGLDAVQILDTGEILFSVRSDAYSDKLNIALHLGDLLSSSGTIVRSNQQLLSRFQPAIGTNDYGLDAIYVWPSGEIWFSTEQDFQDLALGAIAAGDLLSDQGYIVYRNADLLSAFSPTTEPADFGLDALYVISDATPPAPPPLLQLQIDASATGAGLKWQGQGRVFQVERADALSGPFSPLSPILPDLSFGDLNALTNRNEEFYRLMQW